MEKTRDHFAGSKDKLEVAENSKRLGFRRKSNSSILTRCLLDEYAKLESEAAVFKTLFEKAYNGTYGGTKKPPLPLNHSLCHVLSSDYKLDSSFCGRQDSCLAFVGFLG